MKGKYIFWSVFTIGAIISIISFVAVFLPGTNRELYEDIFFLAAGILVLMLTGKRVLEFVDTNREVELSSLTLAQIFCFIVAVSRMASSLYRLIFMLPV